LRVSAKSLLRGLGQEVRERRKRRNLSQEALAFDAGIHPNVVGPLQRGIYNPTVKILHALALERNTSLQDLFAGAAKRQ
jgi:XRE family transcriptional regulator, regulator of sulfur utilization